MAYKMFNKNFEEITINNPNWKYLFVTDYEAFVKEFSDDWILDGIRNDGIYMYDGDMEIWKTLPPSHLEYRIIQDKINDNVDGIKKVISNDVFVGWNIIITLDTGETIKTNSEPVEMSEVQEAINVMLKPSFFGKRIKKFEIVAE